MSTQRRSATLRRPSAAPARARASAARIPATADAPLRAREWVCDRLGRVGWTGESLGDVALVVDEAVQNAVEHGSEPAAPVEVRVDADAREACVIIRDRGRRGVAPPLSDPRLAAPSSVRGRGRTIIAALSEDAAWCAREGGTEVRVRFVAGRDPTAA